MASGASGGGQAVPEENDAVAVQCGNCAKQGVPLFKCLRCEQDSYCGKECQHAAWPTHKRVCQPPLPGVAGAGVAAGGVNAHEGTGILTVGLRSGLVALLLGTRLVSLLPAENSIIMQAATSVGEKVEVLRLSADGRLLAVVSNAGCTATIWDTGGAQESITPSLRAGLLGHDGVGGCVCDGRVNRECQVLFSSLDLRVSQNKRSKFDWEHSLWAESWRVAR